MAGNIGAVLVTHGVWSHPLPVHWLSHQSHKSLDKWTSNRCHKGNSFCPAVTVLYMGIRRMRPLFATVCHVRVTLPLVLRA